MKSFIKKRLSSISVKLFVCFWLIAFTSILTTHFISLHFSKDSKVIEIHKGDLRKLNNIFQKTQKKAFKNTEQFFSHLPERAHKNVVLKHLSTNKILSANKDYYDPELLNFLTKNSLGKLVSVRVKNARITGPYLLNINHENYQIYLLSPDKDKAWGAYLKRLPSWLLVLISLIISMTLCWLLARSLTRPILDIQGVSLELGNGKLAMRVIEAAKRKDELGDLARSFNLMAEKLEQNLSAHQRLLADVSHELRSPLTRMQIALGLIQKNPNDTERRNKHLQRCEKEIQCLDEMIADVLALSKLENTMPTLKLSRLNFISFLHNIVQDCQFVANEKAITIELQNIAPSNMDVTMPADLTLNIDPQLMTSALNNVLNNSIKYAPQNSAVTVTCQHIKDEILVNISDQGTGVPEEKLTHLFKPFYRVSNARDRKSGGTGLGLAIAQQAVAAHQGSISAFNNSHGGLTVSIQLPY